MSRSLLKGVNTKHSVRCSIRLAGISAAMLLFSLLSVPAHAEWVGTARPMMGTEDVMWTCKFRNGLIKRFKFPIRTTPEGQANAYVDLKGKDLESPLLSTQEADGYVLPTPKV